MHAEVSVAQCENRMLERGREETEKPTQSGRRHPAELQTHGRRLRLKQTRARGHGDNVNTETHTVGSITASVGR